MANDPTQPGGQETPQNPRNAALQQIATRVHEQMSPEFADLRERTKADYLKQIRKIEASFGDLPGYVIAAYHLDNLAARINLDGPVVAWRDLAPAELEAVGSAILGAAYAVHIGVPK